ncbi:hypothetical protein LINGRAHAP2_LOCUS27922 [Linum grandiflorum]
MAPLAVLTGSPCEKTLLKSVTGWMVLGLSLAISMPCLPQEISKGERNLVSPRRLIFPLVSSSASCLTWDSSDQSLLGDGVPCSKDWTEQ